QLKQLQRYKFGSKSERFEALEEQKLLFEQLRNLMDDSEEQTETDEEETLEAAAEETGKKKGHDLRFFNSTFLPRLGILHWKSSSFSVSV
ncbi:MAG: hypothetical protein KC964_00970, partial [Candidatus Omnitrophica bacterium]|nr:hypothetical protein [Candidatus Omnitrophota bacterium]